MNIFQVVHPLKLFSNIYLKCSQFSNIYLDTSLQVFAREEKFCGLTNEMPVNRRSKVKAWIAIFLGKILKSYHLLSFKLVHQAVLIVVFIVVVKTKELKAEYLTLPTAWCIGEMRFPYWHSRGLHLVQMRKLDDTNAVIPSIDNRKDSMQNSYRNNMRTHDSSI